MSIRIGAYEDWMKPQVARLFSSQYDVDETAFTKLIENFYEHPFQRERCIRIAATEGEKVIGFQSFFYWPYTFEGKTWRSFQSGNSLVHPDYRGKGIFAALLKYLDEHREEIGIDFLTGFPIAVSRNSLLRNNWKNILDLQWYIHTTGASSFLLLPKKKLTDVFRSSPQLRTETSPSPVSSFRLSQDEDFKNWRADYSGKQSHFYHTCSASGKTVEFALKASIRKKIIRELIIGDIRGDQADENFLAGALTGLLQVIKENRLASLVSFALNPHDSRFPFSALKNPGFRMINKRIFFCVKNFSGNQQVENPAQWVLYRSDVDTW